MKKKIVALLLSVCAVFMLASSVSASSGAVYNSTPVDGHTLMCDIYWYLESTPTTSIFQVWAKYGDPSGIPGGFFHVPVSRIRAINSVVDRITGAELGSSTEDNTEPSAMAKATEKTKLFHVANG